MLVFRFLDEKYGLQSIRERRLRISRIHELNDPFEFMSPYLSDRNLRLALRKTRDELSNSHGILCFSGSWHSPALWGHYADKHRGICLGFNLSPDLVKQVSYVTSRRHWPSSDEPEALQALFSEALFTKFLHWSYEDEYRVYLSLLDEDNGHFFKDFGDLGFCKVIVGAQSKISREEVNSALGDLRGSVECFKARPAFRTFRIVRNKNERLWK